MKKLVAIFILTLGINVYAHEGHEHEVKGVTAPKGGFIKAVHENFAEVVVKGKELKIYIYDKDLKALDLQNIKVTAEAAIPRSNKKENLTLKITGNLIESTFDAKNSHRYVLTINLKMPDEKEADQVKFNIEPKH